METMQVFSIILTVILRRKLFKHFEILVPVIMRMFLRERWFARPPVEERLATFRALAGFPDAERRPYVERGLKSRAAGVRATCRALAEGRLRAPEREAEEPS